MQEARRLRPASAASTMGLLTAFYRLGQIVHPPLVTLLLLLLRSGNAGRGFTLSLEIAAAALVAGALLYLWLVRAFPKRSTTAWWCRRRWRRQRSRICCRRRRHRIVVRKSPFVARHEWRLYSVSRAASTPQPAASKSLSQRR
jgi:hypothetical protein